MNTTINARPYDPTPARRVAFLGLGVMGYPMAGHLALAEFWVVMDHHQWVHPYDARGRRRPVKELPQSLEELVDDPYRSLAGEVRNAGGYPKDATPFAEFLWADFFRRRIAARVVMQHPDEALRMALNLCHTPEAAHLPGWTGPINSHDAQVSG